MAVTPATHQGGPGIQQSTEQPTLSGRSPARALARLQSHLVVALVALVAIGGATRVMEAGLACPDWPLCYGVLLPGRQMNLQVFLEWFHRLDAFAIGVALVILAGVVIWKRRSLPRWSPAVGLLSLLLVCVQGALGALTVTQLLAAPLVTAHLATALLLVGLLSGSRQALLPRPATTKALPPWWRILCLLALAGILVQALLGGAMASQWAADRCLQLGESCLWLGSHRSVATPVSLLACSLAPASLALPAGHRSVQVLAFAVVPLIALQIALGATAMSVRLSEPLITVGHQIGAVLLVALLAAAASAAVQIHGEPTHG